MADTKVYADNSTSRSADGSGSEMRPCPALLVGLSLEALLNKEPICLSVNKSSVKNKKKKSVNVPLK